MQSSFAIHQFGNVLINQAYGDVKINNISIPHGYVNATQMCKANNKTWSNYWKTDKAKSFADKTSTALLNGRPGIITIEGGNYKDLQGTYVHPIIAKHLAIWISDDFALWAMQVIDAVINGDFQALTPEAAKAQVELQKLWDELRSQTKETFWFVTDSIKNYYIKNPRIEKFPGQNYSEYFDCLNLGLFGKKAKQISDELGISKNQLNRDSFGKNSLKKIEMIQRISESQIQIGLNPLDACKKALEVMNYSKSNYKD